MNTPIIATRRLTRTFARYSILAVLTVLFWNVQFYQAQAQTAPSLGMAQSFAVLGASTVTNTGPTVVTGDLGVSPGTSVTGFPPGSVVGGSIHATDALAKEAQAANTTAYGNIAGQACTKSYDLPTDLSGQTLVPGVYCFSSSVGLTGVLTLNAQGDPNAVFIFKAGSTLITGSNAAVVLTPGGQQCNVFWNVGSSATLGTGTHFVGTILALASITLNTDASLFGRALAQTGAVTMDSNTVSVPTCAGPPANIPPTLAKDFSPATIAAGGKSLLTITLFNADIHPASLSAPLVDTFPKGLVVAGSGSTTCGGSVNANAGGTSVTLNGGTIPANGSCTVTVDVTAAAAGNLINSLAAGALRTSNGSNTAPAVATLTVTAGTTGGGGGTGSGGGGGTGSGGGGTGSGGGGTISPTLGKAFLPSSMPVHGVSKLVLTLSNPDKKMDKLTAPLTDNLPMGLTIDGVATTTCGGAVIAMKGSSYVTLKGGSIAAKSSCTVTVPVTADCAGNYYNAIHAGALQTNNGKNAQPALATLTVTAAAPAGGVPALWKYFWPGNVVPGGVSTLYIVLRNTDATPARLTAPFTDHLPTGMEAYGGGTSTCGGTLNASKGSQYVTLTGGAIPINTTCRIIVRVTATTNGKPSSVGKYVNQIGVGVLKTSNGSNRYPASGVLLVSADANQGPTLNKSFYPANIREGQNSTLTLILRNGVGHPAKLTAPFTDHMPRGMVVSGPASTTCGGVVVAGRGSSEVTLQGGSIPANGSCMVKVLVTADCASYWNQISVGALQTTNGSNKETYGAELRVAVN